jgi:hypothetical protein
MINLCTVCMYVYVYVYCKLHVAESCRYSVLPKGNGCGKFEFFPDCLRAVVLIAMLALACM